MRNLIESYRFSGPMGTRRTGYSLTPPSIHWIGRHISFEFWVATSIHRRLWNLSPMIWAYDSIWDDLLIEDPIFIPFSSNPFPTQSIRHNTTPTITSTSNPHSSIQQNARNRALTAPLPHITKPLALRTKPRTTFSLTTPTSAGSSTFNYTESFGIVIVGGVVISLKASDLRRLWEDEEGRGLYWERQRGRCWRGWRGWVW